MLLVSRLKSVLIISFTIEYFWLAERHIDQWLTWTRTKRRSYTSRTLSQTGPINLTILWHFLIQSGACRRTSIHHEAGERSAALQVQGQTTAHGFSNSLKRVMIISSNMGKWLCFPSETLTIPGINLHDKCTLSVNQSSEKGPLQEKTRPRLGVLNLVASCLYHRTWRCRATAMAYVRFLPWLIARLALTLCRWGPHSSFNWKY